MDGIVKAIFSDNQAEMKYVGKNMLRNKLIICINGNNTTHWWETVTNVHHSSYINVHQNWINVYQKKVIVHRADLKAPLCRSRFVISCKNYFNVFRWWSGFDMGKKLRINRPSKKRFCKFVWCHKCTIIPCHYGNIELLRTFGTVSQQWWGGVENVACVF